MYFLALVVLLLVLAGVKSLRASRTGRAIVAVRDNELAAQAVSLDSRRLKLTAIATSGAIAGLAGALYVIQQKGMYADAFSANVSILLFSMVVIGGLGSLPGAVIGAVYIRGAEYFLPAGWDLVAGGLGVLVLLLLLPEGLGGLLYELRDRYLRWVARRRGIVVASLAGEGTLRAARGTRARRARAPRDGGHDVRGKHVTVVPENAETAEEIDASIEALLEEPRSHGTLGPTPHHGRRAGVPAGRAVRPQRGRRARPRGVQRPHPQHPRSLRPQHPGRAGPQLAGRRCRLPARAAAGAPRRPLQPHQDLRRRRSAWGLFSIFTGLAPTVFLLGVARAGSGLGRAVNGSTHNSLIADYYPANVRPAAFGVHRAANSIGQIVGPLAAGGIAYFLGWRTPFFIFAVPTLIFVLLATRLREPARGGQERRALGADEATAATEEEPASFSEAFRMLWAIKTMRRTWMALPFIAVSIIGLTPLVQLFYEQEFGLNEAERGLRHRVGRTGPDPRLPRRHPHRDHGSCGATPRLLPRFVECSSR